MKSDYNKVFKNCKIKINDIINVLGKLPQDFFPPDVIVHATDEDEYVTFEWYFGLHKYVDLSLYGEFGEGRIYFQNKKNVSTFKYSQEKLLECLNILMEG